MGLAVSVVSAPFTRAPHFGRCHHEFADDRLNRRSSGAVIPRVLEHQPVRALTSLLWKPRRLARGPIPSSDRVLGKPGAIHFRRARHHRQAINDMISVS